MTSENSHPAEPGAAGGGESTGPVPVIAEESAAIVALPIESRNLDAAIATGELDTVILDQAMLTAACELLPDRLATLTVLPLQLRLVYIVGQRAGQEFGLDQAKDLAAALGLGAASQMVESVVRGTLGSVAGGLFGGLLGRATGVAAGATVTFASTYALGHAAKQYYAQGRQLSSADLRALFARFQEEATSIYPRVEQRIRELADGNQLDSVLKTIRGT